MRAILIRVSRREPRRTWALFVGGAAFGGWTRTVPLSALESLDEAARLRRAGHVVRRCEPWVRFERTQAGAAFRAAQRGAA